MTRVAPGDGAEALVILHARSWTAVGLFVSGRARLSRVVFRRTHASGGARASGVARYVDRVLRVTFPYGFLCYTP